MRRHVVLYVLLAAMVFACAGAAPNILHVQVSAAGMGPSQVQINDRLMEKSIRFGEVSVKPLGTSGLHEAQVMLANETERDVAFEYRFLWYDARGFEISTVTSWLPAVLGAKEAKGFVSAAPGTNAASFKLMVRSPRPVTSTGS